MCIAVVSSTYSIYTQWRLHHQRTLYEQQLKNLRESSEKARLHGTASQRATIKGQLAEQFFPMMPTNTHEPSDMRFLGDFCDYIVVDGYGRCKDEGHDRIDGVTFIEIKTGKSQLSRHQKLIRDAIQAGRVYWETIRLD